MHILSQAAKCFALVMSFRDLSHQQGRVDFLLTTAQHSMVMGTAGYCQPHTQLLHSALRVRGLS